MGASAIAAGSLVEPQQAAFFKIGYAGSASDLAHADASYDISFDSSVAHLSAIQPTGVQHVICV